MNIDYLKDFICLTEVMNLTVAAELRNTTQSNFSKRLRSLEQWAGHELVDRTSRPISLTSYGEAFLPRAKAILEDLSEFKRNKTPWDISAGGLRVATPHAATHFALPNLMRRIRETLPNIFLLPHLQNQIETARMLSRTECELAIATRHVAVPLAQELEVFRSVDFEIDHLVLVHPPTLSPEHPGPIFVPHKNTYLGKVWLQNEGREPTCAEVEIGLAAEIRAHCLEGSGFGVVPHSLVEADIALGRLAVLKQPTDMAYSYSLYCAPNASPAAREVWDVTCRLTSTIPY